MAVIRSTLIYVVAGARILLQRRRKEPNQGLLSPPGGKLFDGEEPCVGAARELSEETALVARQLTLRGLVHHLGPAPDEEWLQHAFLVQEFDGTPVADRREGELRWYPLDDFLGGRLLLPVADAIYNPWVLDDDVREFRIRIAHRTDGSIESYERRRA